MREVLFYVLIRQFVCCRVAKGLAMAQRIRL